MAIGIQRRARDGAQTHGAKEEPIARGDDTRGRVAVSFFSLFFFSIITFTFQLNQSTRRRFYPKWPSERAQPLHYSQVSSFLPPGMEMPKFVSRRGFLQHSHSSSTCIEMLPTHAPALPATEQDLKVIPLTFNTK